MRIYIALNNLMIDRGVLSITRDTINKCDITAIHPIESPAATASNIHIAAREDGIEPGLWTTNHRIKGNVCFEAFYVKFRLQQKEIGLRIKIKQPIEKKEINNAHTSNK